MERMGGLRMRLMVGFLVLNWPRVDIIAVGVW